MIARTSLMTLIFFSPNAARITSNSVFSAAASAAAAAAAGRRHRDRRRGRDAPFLFEHLRQLGRLDDGQGRQIVDQFCQISHFLLLPLTHLEVDLDDFKT